MLVSKVNDSVLSIFGTPLFARRLADHARLNAELAALLRAERARDPERTMSARGGWQSAKDVFKVKHPATEALRRFAAEAVLHATATVFGRPIDPKAAQIGWESWGNIIPSGGYTKIHNHGRSHWSGVYYIDIGRPDPDWPDNGMIEFVDPRSFPNVLTAPNVALQPTFAVKPENGKMLLFPGWLNHCVNPYHGEGERISVAFNAMIRVEAATPAGAPAIAVVDPAGEVEECDEADNRLDFAVTESVRSERCYRTVTEKGGPGISNRSGRASSLARAHTVDRHTVCITHSTGCPYCKQPPDPVA